MSASVEAQLRRPGVWNRLLKIAFWSTRDRFGAEDLVAETLKRAHEPEGLAWDGKVRFLAFMSFAFRAVFKGWMRRMSNHEVPTDLDDLEDRMVDQAPLPDERLDVRRTGENCRLLAERLVAELAEADPLALRCFDLYATGMSAKDQAAALGCTEEQVHLLHAVIKRRGARIKEEYDVAELERMSLLRAASTAAKADRPSEGALP